MPEFIVEYDEKKCIGSAVCEAVCPEFWILKETGKAQLRGSKLNSGTGKFELEIEEKDFECNKRAAEGCPPGCMVIRNKETGQPVQIDR